MYSLILKTSSEVIDRTHANSLEEAKLFFIERKRMKPKAFNSIYRVEKEELS